MTGGGSRVASVTSWQTRGGGCARAALFRHCRRMCPDEVKGLVTNGATRTVKSKAGTQGTKCQVCAGSAGGRRPNEPLHVTAARLRFLLNLNGHGGAAALERGR